MLDKGRAEPEGPYHGSHEGSGDSSMFHPKSRWARPIDPIDSLRRAAAGLRHGLVLHARVTVPGGAAGHAALRAARIPPRVAPMLLGVAGVQREVHYQYQYQYSYLVPRKKCQRIIGY